MYVCTRVNRYTIWNVAGSPPTNIEVGRVLKNGFEPIAGAAKVVWPGGTTKIPQDTVRLDPPNMSIGWVVETAWATPALRQESRMYAQQAIDEINDDSFILPNTHLVLEIDERVNGNDLTIEAHNDIEARAKAAGRPLAAVLACSSSHMAAIYHPQANVTVTQRNTGVPIVGYDTGAGVLSDQEAFPNFIRLYPPVSETQHIYRKVAFEFGWGRSLGLICDKHDAFSTSFFDLVNGTDPSNPKNLQPPLTSAGDHGLYDIPRLGIAHAEIIDLGQKNRNTTLDALVAAIKAKDVKVFIMFGMTDFIEEIVLYGLERGIFGLDFQLMVISGSVAPIKMDRRCHATMDGAVQILAASISPDYPGLQRASRFWGKHPPTQAPAGADTTTPFSVDGRAPRFKDASIYDSIMLAAVAIDACLQDGCRAVGHGYDEVMPYFRNASIDGVAGPASIKAGSNDPMGRLFSVKVGTDPASNGAEDSGGYAFNEVAVTTRLNTDLQVCEDPQLGEFCSYRISKPGKVKCFASSTNSIDVEWEAALVGDSGLLSEYRVTLFSKTGEQLVATVKSSANKTLLLLAGSGSTAKLEVTFTLDAANVNLRVVPNSVYSVQVVALYDQATIISKPTVCQIGLACIPPITADASAANRCAVGVVDSRNPGGVANCPCLSVSQVYDNFKSGGFMTVDGVLKSEKGVLLSKYPADRDGKAIGATYGGGGCFQHDRTLYSEDPDEPQCADDTGTPLKGAPSWCSNAWCYVDPNNCAQGDLSFGSSFASPKTAYSYQTCGFDNSFIGTCGCSSSEGEEEFHTMGMPSSADEPLLQSNGSIGGAAKDWKCEKCLEGAKCTGGTASTLRVKKGWFVIRRVSKETGAEKRPDLMRCLSPDSCSGMVFILDELGPLPPDAPGPEAACDDVDGMNSTRRGCCQCSPGHTGMLCGTCQSDTPNGFDWVQWENSTGTGCYECSVTKGTATTIVVVVFLLVAISFILVRVLLTQLARPAHVERCFVRAFSTLEDDGAAVVVDKFFGAGSRYGITQKVFIDGLTEMLRHTEGIATTKATPGGAEVNKDVMRLWVKLDADGDGKVSLVEFVNFLYGVKSGKHSPNKLVSLKVWWYSLRIITLKLIIISHFQLSSSIKRAFPLLSHVGNTTVAGNQLRGNGTTSNNPFRVAFVAAGAALSNVDASVFEVVACFVGPRQRDRLLITSLSVVGFLAVSSLIPWVLKKARCK